MPLFGRRLFHLNEDDLKDNNEQEQIYTIEHTGEKFHSKNLYEKLKKVYELERWTCECTWRAGLTHKEAYESEVETRKSLSTIVPNYFHKIIFDIIYHSVKPLEKVAEEVSIILGQGFVIGEPVQFKKRKDTTVVKGIIERIEENDDQRKRISERASVQTRPLSDKQMKNVKYAIRLSDEDRVISNVQPNELQRSNFIPNREKLKIFIRSYAFRLGNRADSPWIFYDESIKEKYQIKDRIPSTVIEQLKKTMTITLDEILREQERIVRKQTEEQNAQSGESRKSNENYNNALSSNGHLNDIPIISSDDETKTKSPKKKVNKSTPTTPKKSTPTTSKKSSQTNNTSPIKKSRTPTKQKSPIKTKKQLTLHDMKFTKNSNNNNNNNNQLLKKSSSTSVTTYNIAVPYSLLQKLDKTRRDRGLQSRVFQRLVLHCARTLNDKQRLRLPDEYRSLIQTKFEELELKRRLSEMTEQEKKIFLQTKQKQKQFEHKSCEDLDLISSKILPLPKQIQSLNHIPSHYIGDLLVICTFFTSSHTLFLSSLADNLSKTTQQFLRSFRHNYLLDAYKTSSTPIFFNYFIEFLQILLKLLFKEDDNRFNNDDINNNDDDDKQQQQQLNSDQQDIEINHSEQLIIDDDIEQVYDTKLTDIPLTSFTCPELTRLYLLKDKNENYRTILDKLANLETKDFSISDQIDLLLLLVNLITTNNEIMSDYFEYLTRTMSETYRERNQLLSERRKAQEEDSKQKKLQLQNGDNGKFSTKKQNKTNSLITSKNSLNTTNDENHQSSPTTILHDDIADSDDDLKSVLQRRRQMVAMSKELKEKRELETQKLHNEQKRELAIQRAEQAYQDALLNLQFGFRIKPLGFDRNYNRYWFFKGHAGLFVEKGWIGSEISYSTQSSSSQDISSSRSSSISINEKLIPKHESNQWWSYDNETVIEQLIQSLNERGIREHNLLANIKKIMPLLHTEFEQIKKDKNSNEHQTEESISNTETSNDQQQQSSNDIISSFKNDLEDIETRLRLGSLGGFIINDNLIEWQTKLKQSNERHDLGELLIQLQQTIPDKFASGIFGTYENQLKNSKTSTKKKLSTIKSTTINQHNLQIWMNDCRTCKTYSRLYILMIIFENSIAWNKSTIGLKCKICRKKNKDEYIIVCDQCCQGYHLECLRSYTINTIQNSTNDLWYCPACRPQSISRRRNNKQEQIKTKSDYYDTDIYDMDVDTTSNISSHDNNHDLSDLNSEPSNNNNNNNNTNIDETNEENLCCVCAVETSDDNELIQCIQCRSFFHCQCHEPPLRCPPRSTTWMCNSCRNGINNETNYSNRRIQTRRQINIRKQEQRSRIQPQRHNGTRGTVRKNYREIDEDEDEYEYEHEQEEIENDDESDYEEETRNQRRSKRTRILSPSSTNDNKSDDDYDIRRPARRRVRIAKSSSSSSSSSSSALSDEEQILANLNDDESDIEQDEDNDEEEENGNIEANSPSSQ
ncbi:unnamed protein product [Rotaria sp. Silwood1]|nr:unnamed protein product [Rotaria sp. Silwood1]CAF3400691.1 unnamed protein product [Rotaria sp. Silwood1]CAF3436716.1 unnamed protein product [Rotaria sp. Silwood1]CAF4575969.1 unnamed protein product [Rotaria sp. Silwood1]CAF4600422.1 unnamed protein product [Rotaria sp. Silwood1]